MRKKQLFHALCLVALAPLAAASAPGFYTLSLKHCVPLEKSAFRAFAQDWAPYERYTRVCPLIASPKDEVKVSLISVFTERYYDDHKDETGWLDFPRSKFVDNDGNCLAIIPYLFPNHNAIPIVVRFKTSQKNRPDPIRVRVASITASGEFNLPDLEWSEEGGRYLINNNLPEKRKEQFRCKK